LYEKGKQERARVPDPDLVSVNWVRLEVQVRPVRDSGYVAASSSPAEVWGFADWTRETARQVLAMDVPRVQVRPWRESDDDRAYRFMLQQYGPLMRRRIDEHGSAAAFGAQLEYDLDQLRLSQTR
jgi:hypothetical protein